MGSWFIGYCLVRTYSNSLETVLIVAAMHYWPADEVSSELISCVNLLIFDKGARKGRRLGLFLAALSVCVRPTAALFWLPIAVQELFILQDTISRAFFIVDSAWIGYVIFLCTRCSPCNSSITLGFATVVDRIFYGQWTFVMWEFLKVNVLHNISAIYGTHPWHWFVLSLTSWIN